MRPIVDHGPGGPPASLYVHIPFCRDRCLYCSFPTVADDPAMHRAVIDAIATEARRGRQSLDEVAPLESIYLGGGTPALLAPKLLSELIGVLRGLWEFTSDLEITLESNPANVSPASLSDWGALGVTRLSIGVQTFRDDVLERLGRRHDAATSRRALTAVGTHWAHSWSADLLAGWAGQSPDQLRTDIDRLVETGAPHISVYALAVEDGTPLARLQHAGEVVTASAALAPELDACCVGSLSSHGLRRYEVSNFARPGHRSRHNQVYWADRSYLGFGPGAASSLHPHRWVNRADLRGYVRAAQAGGPLRALSERVDPAARLIEVLGVGLRTSDGIAWAELGRRFGTAVRDWLLESTAQLEAADLLERGDDGLRIPAGALSRADAIVVDLAAGLRALSLDSDCSEYDHATL